MQVELLAYTQPNPALDPRGLAGISDIAALWSGQGTYQENLIEYAGRVCYRSTHRMGTAPNFITARVREGHEDIIEHVVVTVRISGSDEPLRWRLLNRHCEVTELAEGGWIVSGNVRVWLQLFRQGVALPALPLVRRIAPAVYAEFDDETAAQLETVPMPGSQPPDLQILFPKEAGSMRITLLGYTQPTLDDPEALLHHGAATFLFEGISRACTHQLVRHRLASFSQESQRYVSLEKGGWDAVIPPDVARNPDARQTVEEAWAYLQEVYARLQALGIRKEDARFLLPNAAETRIVTTMNFAAWSHFLWLRAVDKAAQWEIRVLGQAVLQMLYIVAPDAFQEHWTVFQRDFVRPDA